MRSTPLRTRGSQRTAQARATQFCVCVAAALALSSAPLLATAAPAPSTKATLAQATAATVPPAPTKGHQPRQTLYAYATSSPAPAAGRPSSCPRTTKATLQCSLTQALLLAKPGGMVALETPGTSGRYTGNWSVKTAGTSQSAPVLIAAAPGVANPVLTGRSTAVLTIAPGTHVVVSGVTLSNADNDTDGNGGAIYNEKGFLEVEHCTFRDDHAEVASSVQMLTDTASVSGDGGAIDSDGALTVVSSTFTDNAAVVGGAIDAFGGSISGTSFTANSASGTAAINECCYYYWTAAGGAINNSGRPLEVSASTFTANSVVSDWNSSPDGGAIDNAGGGPLAVSGSSFSANYLGVCSSCDQAGSGPVPAGEGAAVASGPGPLTVSASVFSANQPNAGQGTIWDSGEATISASTFSDNVGGTHQEAIVLGHGGTGALWASTFSGKGAVLATAGTRLWVTGDILAAPCQHAGASWQDEGYNVGADATCLGGGKADVGHGASLLGGLGANGGPTKTMLPLAANPARGLIPYGTGVDLDGQPVTLCPTTDQRGVRSAKAARCDAGSVQV